MWDIDICGRGGKFDPFFSGCNRNCEFADMKKGSF